MMSRTHFPSLKYVGTGFVRDLKNMNIMRKYNYYVYIISNWNNEVIYIGVTNNLERRIYEHQNELVEGLSNKYNLSKLVYYEETRDIRVSLQREKEIKKWRREKKNKLIESLNPVWEDLGTKLGFKISQSFQQNKLGLLRNDRYNICGLILTAGLSSRMEKFKPLLNYEGKSFLQTIVQKLNNCCDEIVVVTGHNSDLIKSHLESVNTSTNYRLIYNPNYNDGMFTSLKRGVEAILNCEWVLYHFVDQPTLPADFYSEFINQIDSEHDWIQPVYKGRKGHPILLNTNGVNSILNSNDDSNLRLISQSSEIRKKFWECKFPQILTDIDTNDDYKLLQ